MLTDQMLDWLGFDWLREGAQLVLAQDLAGTFFWIIDTGSERLVGPLGPALASTVRDTWESFQPAPGDWLA